MKMRDVAEVAVSIMGVFSVVIAVVTTPRLVWAAYLFFAQEQQAAASRMKPILLSYIVELAVKLVGGVLLLLLAGRIADWMARRSASAGDADVDLRIVSPEGFRLCLKLVGIFALITALATLGGLDLAHLVMGALNLAVGLYLLFGGGWLARFAWGNAAAEPHGAGERI